MTSVDTVITFLCSARAIATNAVFKFPKVQLSDEGVYQCVAENKVGMVVTATQVKVLSKLVKAVFSLQQVIVGHGGKFHLVAKALGYVYETKFESFSREQGILHRIESIYPIIPQNHYSSKCFT